MKKLLAIVLALAILAGLGTTALAAEPSYSGKTVILYTGNIRGRIDLYPQIKALKDSYQAKGADVLLLDAGNFLQGTTWSDTHMGADVYDLMDAAGYDAASMGWAEFSYGEATTGYIYHGNFTRYHTQAMLQDGTGEISYKVNNKEGDEARTATLPARAGAKFSVICSHVENLPREGKAANYSFLRWEELTTKSGLRFRILDGDNNDFLDRLPTHAGLIADSSYAIPTGKVDFTLQLCTEADSDPVQDPNCGKELVLRPAKEAQVMGGVVVIDNATKAVTSEPLKLDAADADLAAKVAAVKAASEMVQGKVTVTLEGRDSESRNRETNFGDLVTDALLWYAPKFVDGYDKSLPTVAIFNGGNLDDFLYPGDLTETNLLRALPFSPMGIGVIQLTGRQLLEVLEAGCQQPDCPGFVHVSGMKYSIQTDKAFDPGEAYGKFYRAASINRVTIDEIGGKAFSEKAKYNVVADNFLMNGNDTYYVLSEAKAAGAPYVNNGGGVKVRNIVHTYVTKVLGGTIGDAYAQPQGRITLKTTPPVWERFTDVEEKAFYTDAVDWAVRHEPQITKGTSKTTFSPYETCTRAQVVTFLWRASNCPAPKTAVCPFTDVSKDEYYYKAVLWAVEKGITKGASATAFDPNGQCTREQVVTFLWRAEGKPKAGGSSVAFTDVDPAGYAYRAIVWAVNHKPQITKGTSKTTFSPYAVCTRGEIVTFLFRALGQ